jgi:hypothetical protein
MPSSWRTKEKPGLPPHADAAGWKSSPPNTSPTSVKSSARAKQGARGRTGLPFELAQRGAPVLHHGVPRVGDLGRRAGARILDLELADVLEQLDVLARRAKPEALLGCCHVGRLRRSRLGDADGRLRAARTGRRCASISRSSPDTVSESAPAGIASVQRRLESAAPWVTEHEAPRPTASVSVVPRKSA